MMAAFPAQPWIAPMDRPALRQMLADIAAGRIDTVVVHKVDRLTRTLADFAKIVELFDARNVAFVSVTQQFNTTTSMGRLTLAAHYPGEHPPIIDLDLWEQVQALLAGNSVDRKLGRPAKSPSLLAGLIYDSAGNRMTPTHAVKDGKRYRYYVSHPLITTGRSENASTCRLPAAEIERIVGDRIATFLGDGSAVFDAAGAAVASTAERKRLVDQAARLAASWPTLLAERQRQLLCALLARIEVADETLSIHLRPGRVAAAVTGDGPAAIATDANAAADIIVLTIATCLSRVGQGTRMAITGANAGNPDAGMVRLLAQAHQVHRRLIQGTHASIAEFAAREQMTGSYITRLLRLVWLAPDITQAILTGRHPPALSTIKLMQSGRLPSDWTQQRAMLGFG